MHFSSVYIVLSDASATKLVDTHSIRVGVFRLNYNITLKVLCMTI